MSAPAVPVGADAPIMEVMATMRAMRRLKPDPVPDELLDTLVEGNVVTVEPGIYLDGDWGARIEDIVVVTADGCERLNTRPRDLVVL